MTTKISDLTPALKQATIYTIMTEDYKPALIDARLNSTGHDLALFFSTAEKALAYRDRYPSLRRLAVYEATVAEMEEIFGGRVEYYVVDNVPTPAAEAHE